MLSKHLTKPLGEILDGYDRVIRRLQPFERVVCDLTVKARELAGYGSLSETLENVRELRKNSLALCKAAAQAGKNAESRKLAEAEVDILIDAAEELWFRDGWAVDLLLDIGKELRNVPMLDTSLDTVVLVGSPNVGKSSIVRAISTGTPEVNNYPFTTRGMTLGHVIDNEGERVCQARA
jgi:nucleolar GTP-binding protein